MPFEYLPSMVSAILKATRDVLLFEGYLPDNKWIKIGWRALTIEWTSYYANEGLLKITYKIYRHIGFKYG